MPVVTRIGGRGDGAAVDDGPGCRRRADAAALSSRGRDLGGRGPKRRVLRQADGGRAQTSLSWLADTLLSQDRAAPIRFCRPTTCALAVAAARSSPGRAATTLRRALACTDRRNGGGVDRATVRGASLRVIRALSSDRTDLELSHHPGVLRTHLGRGDLGARHHVRRKPSRVISARQRRCGLVFFQPTTALIDD